MAIELQKRLFTVDDCLRMLDAGILTQEDRLELIDGELIKMSPIGNPHKAAVDRATRFLVTLLGDRAIVRVQSDVVLDEYNAPEPDLALLRPRKDFYRSRAPGTKDIFLFIEVSETSIRYDRKIKAELYARFGVTEYWIADLNAGCVLAHSEPSNDSYHVVRKLHRGDTVAPILLPKFQIPIDILL